VINVLFLGASKRVSLLERFLRAGNDLGLRLNLFTCEKNDDFVPTSALSRTLPGPSFESPEFKTWLRQTIDRFHIDIVIPNMDSATVALSSFAEIYTGTPMPFFAVSSAELCRTLEDKVNAEEFFLGNQIPVPRNTPLSFPKIVKPRMGFGAKGLRKMNDGEELDFFFKRHPAGDYIVQDFVEGQETTVDFYVSRTGQLIGYVLRDRIEVSDGEVMVCRTRRPSPRESKLIEHTAAISGWKGCITLQYITDRSGHLFVIEINPRFGGGATCGIEAGLDMAKYTLQEFLGTTPTPNPTIRVIRMVRARRDFFVDIDN
jgi:carbamoyl-phosphate synthase large subunit